MLNAKKDWQISPRSQTWEEDASYAFIQPETIEEERMYVRGLRERRWMNKIRERRWVSEVVSEHVSAV